MKKEQGKVGLYVYIDKNLKAQFKAICAFNNENIYDVVEKLIREYVDKKIREE